MNCKPGDLAIVFRTKPEGERFLGMMVEILYAQPFVRFQLPDGQWHAPASAPERWVIRILGAKRQAPLIEGGTRWASYGTGGDWAMKPISGLPLDESEKENLREPA